MGVNTIRACADRFILCPDAISVSADAIRLSTDILIVFPNAIRISVRRRRQYRRKCCGLLWA